MRILITGGQGQLGRALQPALAQHEVLALGHRELDVCDAARVRRMIAALRPALVIHAAAWTDTRGCEADPQRALRINGQGTRQVAEACASIGAALLYVSSNEVFDGEKSQPYREDDPPNPINSYGRSKLEGERWVQSLLSRYYIVRTAWLYGGGNDFPAKILRAAANDGALKVVTDEVASPTWAPHLAQAMAKLILRPAWGIYHLTNSGHCSRFHWAQRTLALAGLGDVRIETTSQEGFGAPYRKPPFSVLGNYNAARLGIELPTWEEALAEYMAGSRASFAPASR